MNKAELESKNLSELHKLAAGAGVERYRMLSRAELIMKLGGGPSQGSQSQGSQDSQRAPRSGSSEQGDRPPRRRRSRGGRKPTADGGGAGRDSGRGPGREPRDKPQRAPEPEPTPAPEPPTPAPTSAAASSSAESTGRPRRRRRRRFGRRGKQGVGLQDLLLPPAAGRQAILCAATREGCTTLLRGIAADLSGEANGPDPVVLLIDPAPEELADWRRDAPQAEIVAAGQPRHASDALAQASARASSGDDVILLVDSLTRLAEAYEDPDAAKQFFDAGRVQAGAGNGSLTVVAALERPASS
jgi:hypothetical protein